MNDPNGMVYFNHTYHLFFQYYPGATVWGPMHWGHATSTDLIHWKQLPIALYPDSLGYIFSGSAVVDTHNTSSFGKNGKTPLVAIFTHHDPKGAAENKNNFQNESLAYSLDNGATWTKYAGNPVLKNPGITDFRDPKVMWFESGKKWIMTLAVKDHINFYSSADLKSWKKLSEFGMGIGAHGGVWECPDLFPLKLNGKTYWVLIVNINPGGPNGGSATQYFIGQFDGIKFSPIDTHTRWLDYGPDEYAGVTWNNTGNRRIFLGWMSNWLYATQVPTKSWRSAMTVPRELKLADYNNDIIVTSAPVDELNHLRKKTLAFKSIPVSPKVNLNKMLGDLSTQYTLHLNVGSEQGISVELSNTKGEKLTLGYHKGKNEYFIDRTHAGISTFNKDFEGKFTAPRLSGNKTIRLTLVVDKASVELFADEGATVMTCIFFPHQPLDKLSIIADKDFEETPLSYSPLKPIW